MKEIMNDYFDLKRVVGAYGSSTWMLSMMNEQTRCCKNIDARIIRIMDEDTGLNKELDRIESQLKLPHSFFTHLRLHFKMSGINRQKEWRRKVLGELYDARYRRTFSW